MLDRNFPNPQQKFEDMSDCDIPNIEELGEKEMVLLRMMQELKNIIQEKPHTEVVDFGCGNGKLVRDLSYDNPQAHFTGHEPDRSNEKSLVKMSDRDNRN